MASLMSPEESAGYDDLTRASAIPEFRDRFLANRQWAAMVRTTFAMTMLRGSEKSNVIPPEASAQLDCRMLAGDDPEEIAAWVRGVIADEHVQVTIAREPKIPNLSPPDTELYKATGRRDAAAGSGVVVAPMILVAFTDCWVFRRCGLHAYGFSPFVIDESELQRIHGNDERISLENLREGVRVYTEMLEGRWRAHRLAARR